MLRRGLVRFCGAGSTGIGFKAATVGAVGSRSDGVTTAGAEVSDPLKADPVSEPLTETQQSFLKNFREKLDSDPDGADLDSFVPKQTMSPTAIAVGPLKRGAEPLPSWLKMKIPKGASTQPRYNSIKKNLGEKKLSTVCEEAKCPNIGECWGGGDHGEAATATIMLMGSICTRGCRFCSIGTSKNPPPLDPEEPEKTADAVSQMGVDYIVVTMVDRDDLPDGGSAHVGQCLRKLKEKTEGKLLVECLAGDFRANFEHVSNVAGSGLDVFAHNIECVERVTPNVRDRRASYRQSLTVLEYVSKQHPSLLTKSSIMLGLGEKEEEIRQTLKDLRNVGVSCVTLGQYLQPSRTRLKVSRYAHPTEFEMWEKEAVAMGFLYCASGPMVRSSYRAGEYYIKNILKKGKSPSAACATTAGSGGCCGGSSAKTAAAAASSSSSS